MQYYTLSAKKFHFIITPEELCDVLKGFDHVVTNTGVARDYIKRDPEAVIRKYTALYQKLTSGAELIYRFDHHITALNTGITGHLENCLYKPTSRLSVPCFSEPCPELDTFCFLLEKEQLSTSFSVDQYIENVCGLYLWFPSRVEYPTAAEGHPAGITETSRMADHETFEILTDRIKAITKPLAVETDGKLKRTRVRISSNAKKDIVHFYFFSSHSIRVI